MTVVLAVLGLLIAALAIVGFRYLTRGTPVKRVHAMGGEDGVPPVFDERFRQTMELLSRFSLTDGNRVDLLLNGDQTYPRLFDDLASAERSITLQMYYCQPGQLANRFKEVLLDRARAGVRVLFLFDAVGSMKLGKQYLQALRDGGVAVSVFRPVKWYALEKAYNRSHIRVVCIDGHIGYTGGFGIDDKWLGSGRHPNQWRETNVRFSGPAVDDLQATFVAGWAEATGDLLTGDLYFPVLEERRADSGVPAAVLHSAPTIGSTAAERYLALSIAAARRSLYVTNPYFVPDEDFVGMLCEAAERGVDVRILTAGRHNDVKSAWYAGRSCFEQMLAAGVRIYEYLPSNIHAKTFVVDKCWSSVGTMNFDNRSLAFNDESNLAVLAEDFATRLHDVFLEDLEFSKELILEEFRRRPVYEKVLEKAAAAMGRLL